MPQVLQTQSSIDKPRLRGQKVDLGRMVMTRSVADLVASGRINPLRYIARHAVCDWGDVCADDWQANNLAMQTEGSYARKWCMSKNT